MSEPLDLARYIFMNDEDELRSGWRVLAFLFFFVIAEMMLAGLIKTMTTFFPSLGYVAAAQPADEALTIRRLTILWLDRARDLASAVLATLISARWLERRSFSSVGFKLHRGWIKDFALGSVMGSSALAIAVGIAAAAGALSFDVRAQTAPMLLRGLLLTLIFFVVAGATEELVFRGFPFQALAHNLGGAAAVGLTAVLFGLAHVWNENASVFSTINTVLAGIWLGSAYLITRSLWLATAVHYSWNFAMVYIFGLPVSGFTTLNRLSWLQGHPGPPTWVSGGSYGPEAGAGATIAVILSAAVIWKSGWFRPSEEMLATIRHGKREAGLPSIIPRETRSEGSGGESA